MVIKGFDGSMIILEDVEAMAIEFDTIQRAISVKIPTMKAYLSDILPKEQAIACIDYIYESMQAGRNFIDLRKAPGMEVDK